MPFPQEDLEEFKQIYREEYNEELSDERTLELATSVFNLMEVVYRPLPATAEGLEHKTTELPRKPENL